MICYLSKQAGSNTSLLSLFQSTRNEQESPAVADKPARRESMSKIAPIRRAYNVVADNTGLSFIHLAVVASETGTSILHGGPGPAPSQYFARGPSIIRPPIIRLQQATKFQMH